MADAGGEHGPLLLEAGARVGGKYELVECLGEGGMGTVWSARHLSLGHAVAIKFLQGATQSSDARARFDREARIAARLGEASRHIARVIDHGVLRDVVPYLVMELLHGETLSSRLKRRARLPLPVAAKLTTQLCRALQAAHLAGVVHRDLKPANIFLCAGEADDDVLLKLMDFGVAKAARESEDEPTTRAGLAVGTPSYMSPEQILCKRVDARSDLWGVAAVVYRMATGRSPFGHGGIAELGLRILATDPAPPSTLVAQLPASFDAWIAKALAKNPEERFQSARDLADALALVAGLAAGAREPIVSASDLSPSIGLGVEDAAAAGRALEVTRSTRPEGLRPVALRPRRHEGRARRRVGLALSACTPLLLLALIAWTRPPTLAPAAIPIASAWTRAPLAPLAPRPIEPPGTSASTSSEPSAAPSSSGPLLATRPPSAPASSPPSAPSLRAPSPSRATAPTATTASGLRSQADALWHKKDEL